MKWKKNQQRIVVIRIKSTYHRHIMDWYYVHFLSWYLLQERTHFLTTWIHGCVLGLTLNASPNSCRRLEFSILASVAVGCWQNKHLINLTIHTTSLLPSQSVSAIRITVRWKVILRFSFILQLTLTPQNGITSRHIKKTIES